MPASRDWVLFRAEAHSSRAVRSAMAHKLLIGSGFVFLLVLTGGEVVRASLGPASAEAMRPVVLEAALLAVLPAPLFLLRRRLQGVLALEVDPAGLALTTASGLVRVRLDELEEVRPGAEPALQAGEGPGQRGPFAALPAYAATLQVRARDGRAWRFTAARPEDAEGVLAWLGVLGATHALRGAPSALAARAVSSARIALATPLLRAAVTLAASALAIQLATRFARVELPAAPLIVFSLMVSGAALYCLSWRAQMQAARAWLEARGLGTGPPTRDLDAEAAAPLAR